MYLNTHDIGWRLRTLRLRYGLSLSDVAQRSNLDISYISRLERDALANAKPKPDTINRVLEAIGASPAEQDAVYHLEHTSVDVPTIKHVIDEVAAQVEDDPEPVEILDDRWCAWYFNRAARAALGLSEDEYKRVIGTHLLETVIDPENPRYTRFPEEEREEAFALRARMFLVNFAAQEFDEWYRDIVDRVKRIEWAARIWEHTELAPKSLVLERHDFTILNPITGPLKLRFQFNHLMTDTRFLMVTWNFTDQITGIELAVLRTMPAFAYSYKVGYPEEPAENQETRGSAASGSCEPEMAHDQVATRA